MKIMNSIESICKNSNKIHSEKKELYAVVVQNQTEVTYGFDNDCDIQYCEKNNIPCFDRNSNGGCIVHCKGNISLTLLFENQKHPELSINTVLFDLLYFLQNKGLNIILDGNDLLVDGFKVISGYEINIAPDWKWKKIGVQISINQDLKIIEKVCNKPMVKVPKGLSEYFISSNDIIVWIDSYLKYNSISESV